MKANDHTRPRESRLTARATTAGLVGATSVSMAILLARTVPLGTTSMLAAAGGLLVLAAALVLALPLLERLPAPRPRPVAPVRVTSSPRQVRQPVSR